MTEVQGKWVEFAKERLHTVLDGREEITITIRGERNIENFVAAQIAMLPLDAQERFVDYFDACAIDAEIKRALGEIT
jgi:hypothetical protein